MPLQHIPAKLSGSTANVLISVSHSNLEVLWSMSAHVRVVKLGEPVKCLASEADGLNSLVAFYSLLPFLSNAKHFGVIFIKGP